MSLNVDKMVNQLAIGQEVTWSPEFLKLDAASFHDYVNRVLELTVDGVVEATLTHRESQSGKRYWDLIRFKRLK